MSPEFKQQRATIAGTRDCIIPGASETLTHHKLNVKAGQIGQNSGQATHMVMTEFWPTSYLNFGQMID